jgi:hypothetical protein
MSEYSAEAFSSFRVKRTKDRKYIMMSMDLVKLWIRAGWYLPVWAELRSDRQECNVRISYAVSCGLRGQFGFGQKASVNRSSVHLIKQTQGSLSSLSTGLFHVLVDISIN